MKNIDDDQYLDSAVKSFDKYGVNNYAIGVNFEKSSWQQNYGGINKYAFGYRQFIKE